MTKNRGEKQKGTQQKHGDSQPSILSFLTPAFAVMASMSATPVTAGTLNGPPAETGKKRSLDKDNDRVSPDGKLQRFEEEIVEIPQPQKGNGNRNETYEKVVGILNELGPIVTNRDSPTPEAFNALYQIVIYLADVVLKDFSTVDRVVKENREIRESNQNMKYAQHCENLKREMEKSQRTVKILDMPIEDSTINGKIENFNTARDNIKATLKTKMNVAPDTLIGSTISINSKSIRDGNTPVAIVAADKDKKIAIEKALRAASKKVVVEWPSYLYSHIKEIRRGYTNSVSFKDSQILIRPSASNNKLVISFRKTFNERWNYLETLNFPLNPSDITKFGQNKQPCHSTNKEVHFNFANVKEYHRSIPENNIETLANGFQPAKKGVPSMPHPSDSRPTTPTRNSFNMLMEQ